MSSICDSLQADSHAEIVKLSVKLQTERKFAKAFEREAIDTASVDVEWVKDCF